MSDPIVGASRVMPSTNGSTRKRALVIGSGHRVRNAFLPALDCVRSRVDVVGVHSRNVEHAREAGRPWGIDPVEDLRSLRPGDVDMVLVSVTVTNNADVLRAVSHLAPGADLVLDTPGIGRATDLAKMPLFRQWAQVRIGEDFMNLPQYRLVRRAIESGALGDVTRITLTHMGYRFHALALLRSWLSLAKPAYSRIRRVRGDGVDIAYHFPGGVVGEVVEPYRRAEGSFVVEGTRGSLVGHPMGHPLTDPIDQRRTGTALQLTRLDDGGELRGFGIDGLDGALEVDLPHMARVRAMGLEDDSEFNLLRVDGLSRIIASLWSDDSLNCSYRLEDGMADLLVSALARHLPWAAAPQTANKNVIDLAAAVIGRLREPVG